MNSGEQPSDVHTRQASLAILALLRVGFTEPLESPRTLVVSYTTVSPLPPRKRSGGLFSVALSRGSPRVGVTHHPALWSPDFPHRSCLRRGRPAGSSQRQRIGCAHTIPRVSHSVEIVSARDAEAGALIEALNADLAGPGYLPEEQFGYSLEQLEAKGVHLVGARVDGHLVGIGGIELQGEGVAELKRFFVLPEHRGAGVADAVITALLEHAQEQGVTIVRLETGDKQHAAIGFYRRHGFVEVSRFPPYLDSEASVCMGRRL